jgi:hypothetical protein
MPRRPTTIGDFIAVEARQMHLELSSTGLRYRVGREDRAYGQHPSGAYVIFGMSSSASLHWPDISHYDPFAERKLPAEDAEARVAILAGAVLGLPVTREAGSIYYAASRAVTGIRT